MVGRPPDSPWQDSTMNVELHAHRWQQFIQQNALVVNVDPAIVEQYVQARLSAERAGLEAEVSGMRAEAIVAVNAARSRLQNEAVISQAEATVRTREAETSAATAVALATSQARGDVVTAQAEAAARTHVAEAQAAAATRVAETEARLAAEAYNLRSQQDRITVQAAVAQAEHTARGAAFERDQIIAKAAKEATDLRETVQRLKQQLKDSQEASLEEMQDLRDEYEEKLACSREPRETAPSIGGFPERSKAKHDASAEDCWDYELGDFAAGKGPSDSRASFRAADR
jgi:myosin heavy subunit